LPKGENGKAGLGEGGRGRTASAVTSPGRNPSVNGKPWFEKCHDCGNDTFKVRVTPYGVCGSDTEWICAKCGVEQGGVFNDPLDEIPPEIFGRARNQKVKT